MRIVRNAMIGLALAGLLATSPAAAKDPPKPSTHVNALAACRAIADNTARLACFDKASAELIAATEKGDVSVVDRAQMREARRSLFGFNMPRLPFFAGDKSAEDDTGELESTITAVGSIGHGKFQFRIADGNAMWETTETFMALRDPKTGQKVKIIRGPLGSYMIKFNGQRAVKGRRIG